MKKFKIILAWSLVFTWMGIIFFFSGMDATSSDTGSKKTLEQAISTTVGATNKVGLTNKHPTTEKMHSVVTNWNFFFRKMIHVSIYLILVLLFINAFHLSGLKLLKNIFYSSLLSFIYACTDEYHQTFIAGRTGQFIDVLIDSLGIFIGVVIILFSVFIITKFQRQNNKKQLNLSN